jgi:phosphohistidine phosphatase
MAARTLHIVRHGKALHDYRAIRDYDRPLVEKGIITSEAVAGRLHAQYAAPALIISSHAARALQTAHIFARVMHYPHGRVQVSEKLYTDGEAEAYSILESLPDELHSVMIVGHNPDVTYVASTYAGRSIDPLPTSGAVTIRFEASRWSEIDRAKATCAVLFPDS